ncbi:NAD(P)/FAD-dependent oxidoreductase [Nocardia pseudobrasiliensis]|uniref:FADH2 O2-dependent halogenase n=1 Tax=Nocardia pseudobrasiliensis TaxID=45979 RepID=A0A370IBP7_9NOCA|nr:tryptophan 7-halogenase [Nocardia pseudobrasiliensis]RDI68148.1 FADH2 O2-dependent halogenase [Nocardia pseudobrasiliensis]
MNNNKSRRYDVAIVGGGIGGSILAAILARHGVRVVLFEGGGHPRFAIGESTIPETTLGLRVLAARYDVPEIADMAAYGSVRRKITSSCGVKRNFSFVHHREGEPVRGTDCAQFPALSAPLGPDVHYYRQDIDAWSYQLALSYGADGYNHTFVTGVEFDSDGATLATVDKGEFRVDYVVDAGGMNSLLGKQLELRVDPPTYQTRTRTLFGHFVGVLPFDEVAPPASEHKMPQPLSQGTLHHLFEGGWVWVIPFDNHPQSTNPLCSVGISLDLDRYPVNENESPEEEFWAHVNRFPTFARQMRNAKAVRPVARTGRVQFQSRNIVGDRWCLLPHASDFIDPLTSSGLSITAMAVNVLADRLIDGVRTGDFAPERFEYLETWVKRGFEYYDKLVGYSFTSFDSFELFNAWFRVWTINTLYGSNGLMEALWAFDRTNNPTVFSVLEQPPYRGMQGQDNPHCAELFRKACQAMQDYRDKEIETAEACDRIYAALSDSGLVPSTWKQTDSTERSPATALTLIPMAQVLAWGKFRSPAYVRGHYMQHGVTEVLGRASAFYRDEVRHSAAAAYYATRDLVAVRNRDWRKIGAKITRRANHGGGDR